MGYITKYELTTLENISRKIRESMVNDLSKEIYGDNDEGYSFFNELLEEPMKWYEHEKMMKEFSLKYPGYTFFLSGSGEDKDDMWRKYFRNGMVKTIRAKIVFEDFDPSYFRDQDITQILG